MADVLWRDITDDPRIKPETDIYNHAIRVYIACTCGEHFDWWDRTSEVHLCPGCQKPYRTRAQFVVEAYE